MYFSLQRSLQKCTAIGCTSCGSTQRERMLTSFRADCTLTLSAARPSIHSCPVRFVRPHVSHTNLIICATSTDNLDAQFRDRGLRRQGSSGRLCIRARLQLCRSARRLGTRRRGAATTDSPPPQSRNRLYQRSQNFFGCCLTISDVLLEPVHGEVTSFIQDFFVLFSNFSKEFHSGSPIMAQVGLFDN